jgi:hypothetical protein
MDLGFIRRPIDPADETIVQLIVSESNGALFAWAVFTLLVVVSLACLAVLVMKKRMLGSVLSRLRFVGFGFCGILLAVGPIGFIGVLIGGRSIFCIST